MGVGDSLRGVINNATGASAIGKALGGTPASKAQTGDFMRSTRGNGHTTSGLDQAMQDHADKVHPVKPAATGGDWDK